MTVTTSGEWEETVMALITAGPLLGSHQPEAPLTVLSHPGCTSITVCLDRLPNRMGVGGCGWGGSFQPTATKRQETGGKQSRASARNKERADTLRENSSHRACLCTLALAEISKGLLL